MSHEKVLLIEGIVLGLVLVGHKVGILYGAKSFLKNNKKKEQVIEEDERKEA